MRNYILSQDYYKSSYTLKKGQPYRFKIKAAGWDNRDRVVVVAKVISGEFTKSQAAHQLGCCVNSISNWIKTLDGNNPRMDG